MSGVRYNERALFVGPTEAGKSELLNAFFSQFECQRLLVDTKMGGEWSIGDIEPISDPDLIDWTQPIVHYVTATTDVPEIEELFDRCLRRRHLVVAVHELNDLAEYSTQKTPKTVSRYLSQGASNGLGFLGATQEPVDMPKRARSMIQHLYTMVPPIDAEHLKTVCRVVEGVTPEEMRRMIVDAERAHGPHSFIHWPRGIRQPPTVWGPLPPWMLEQSIVKRRTPHARERSG